MRTHAVSVPVRAGLRRVGKVPVLAALAVMLSGCITPPQSAATLAQPKTPVVKTITSFSQAKRCMDQLFLDSGKRGIPITLGDVLDATGSVKIGRKDIIINSVLDMSQRSGAFEVFTTEGDPGPVPTLQAHFAPTAKLEPSMLPRVYIRGSISQSDNNITSDNQSVGVTLPFASVGAGEGQQSSTVSVDLQIASLETRRIVPGATTSNTITIVNNDDDQSARGLIRQGGFGAGLSVSLSSSQREGRGQAVRTLLDYSLIELLGKYTRVPYQRCLGLESADPATMQTALNFWEDLDPAARTRAVQTALAVLGLYSGPADGVMTTRLQDAVTTAKNQRGLIPDGRIDFQLFNALYEENVLPREIVPPPPRNPAVRPPRPDGAVPVGGRDPLGLQVELPRDGLALGESVHLKISTAVPAQVWCYYEFVQDGALVTTRVFPNRFQPDNLVRPGAAVTVPRPSDPFKIRFTREGVEGVACVARQPGGLPAAVRALVAQADLEPLQCEYPGVSCPVYEHQKADGLNLSSRKVVFEATR